MSQSIPYFKSYYRIVYTGEEEDEPLMSAHANNDHTTPSNNPNECSTNNLNESWYESSSSDPEDLRSDFNNLTMNSPNLDRDNIETNETTMGAVGSAAADNATEDSDVSTTPSVVREHNRYEEFLNDLRRDDGHDQGQDESAQPEEARDDDDELGDGECSELTSEEEKGGKRSKHFSHSEMGASKKNKKKQPNSAEDKARKKESQAQARQRLQRKAAKDVREKARVQMGGRPRMDRQQHGQDDPSVLMPPPLPPVGDVADPSANVGTPPASTSDRQAASTPRPDRSEEAPVLDVSDHVIPDADRSVRNSLLAISMDNNPPTPQGAERERRRAQMAQEVARLEANNPNTVAKKQATNRAPDDSTFEITRLDSSPLNNYFKDAAGMLAEARRYEDDGKPPQQRLKFDSRRTRSQDWIVWTLCPRTKEWLRSFFSGFFSTQFKVTVVSERGEIFKYGLRAMYPDSLKSEGEIMDFFMEANRVPGWVRHHATTIRYKNPDVDRAYKKAVKDGKIKNFDDDEEEFTKLVMIKVDEQAHAFLDTNMDELALGIGAMDLQIFRIKSNKEKEEEANKPRTPSKRQGEQPDQTEATPPRNRPRQGGDGEKRTTDPTEAETEGEKQDQRFSTGTDEDGSIVMTFQGPINQGDAAVRDRNKEGE